MLTGAPPFARRGKTELACKVVLEGERPPRPRDSEKLGFTDEVWESLRRCWDKKPSHRPSIDAVSTCLERAVETWIVDVPAFMLASANRVREVTNLKEDQSREFADKLAEVRYHEILNPKSDFRFQFQELDQIEIGERSGKTYLKVLQRLCGVLPGSFLLRGV